MAGHGSPPLNVVWIDGWIKNRAGEWVIVWRSLILSSKDPATLTDQSFFHCFSRYRDSGDPSPMP
eukprot:3130257-Amphidinium_carterae.1